MMHPIEIITKRFEEFRFEYSECIRIIPLEGDDSTLFVCSGMQLLKPFFVSPTHIGYSNNQWCIRTNDIDLVGDGSHLTFFHMLGTFGFGTYNYEMHVELWHLIMQDLGIRVDHVTVHPDSRHFDMWFKRGYSLWDDLSCKWSDGNIGGYCSEMHFDQGQGSYLEIGNLVNPLEHSVDVGFGMERIYQLVEGKQRVDETSLFDQTLDPVSRDHIRTLKVFYKHGINPGNKGREYVCRRLFRKMLRLNPLDKGFNSFHSSDCFRHWYDSEHKRMEQSLKEGRKFYKKNPNHPPEFWKETFGVMPEEMELLKP
jgi:alanyl-tRNA synthetase